MNPEKLKTFKGFLSRPGKNLKPRPTAKPPKKPPKNPPIIVPIPGHIAVPSAAPYYKPIIPTPYPAPVYKTVLPASANFSGPLRLSSVIVAPKLRRINPPDKTGPAFCPIFLAKD